ncbi:Lytic transglycosylase catalytic [Catenovulum agarivorans DS-2]|uniref:Lytic transglycosylase catalytic n=1 Tax=Catenovulum agarivorans DS-2 TaxID=1328313 RepID=W7QRK2_9ALTE|nr:lytic transglycosylase domain-containing protein [Catenovulum agarivorans]EWH11602.1 Lytic transglycosylase catalytic [Catenovulum agarivorans DS-2]
MYFLKQVLSKICCAGLLFAVSSSSYASNQIEDVEARLSKQRVWFVEHERKAAKASLSTINKWRESYGDYPLFPYIELAYLKKHPYLSNKQAIRAFLHLYEGTALEWSLRMPWLRYLAKKNEAILFLNDFKPTSNAELNCHKLRFQLQIGGKIEDLADDIMPLWVVGKSQPKACDPLFKQWADAGLRTTDMVKRRVVLAADGGRHTLIPYLTRLLPKSEQGWAKLWHSVRRDPARITRLSSFNKTAEYAQIQVYGIQRLIWRDPERAIKHYGKMLEHFSIDAKSLDEIHYTFALALASKGHDQATQWLTRIPRHLKDSKIVHWHLATYLRNKQWDKVIDLYHSLPESLQALSANKYWLARAEVALGINSESASFTQLAQTRHYYGFLAAARTQIKYHLNHKGVEIDLDILARLKDAPSAKRAYEFFVLQRYTQARREWYKFKQGLDKIEQANAAYLAHQWHWYDQALRGISQAGYHDEVSLRFPRAYVDLYQKYSEQAGIELTLAMAVSRRESSFMVDANSSAGARGLMQIMPATAKTLAGRKFNPYRLFTAETNVELGTKYLAQLTDRMNGQIPLAIASYNAGYHRVLKWIPQEEPVPLDIWIETIPYKETREYVKAVLAYQQVYELFNQQPKDIFADIVNKHVVKRR